jgi:exonuclease SbcC
MRPVRVVMQAFGPFAGVQVVDFRELGDNRFFLIHGPTGSGKTTVLDAMCYALYGTTTGAERTAEEMRSQFAPDSLPTEVVFDFAIGEGLYRVRRRPAQVRAKTRGAGTTAIPAEACVWRRTPGLPDSEDGTPLAVRAREVDATVKDVLGFDVNQFRQVVMLPQGRFRELLSADSKKREEIMRALFATSRYGDIEDALKRRKSDLEAGMAKSRTRRDEALRNAGVESDEQLAESVSSATAVLAHAVAARQVAQTTAQAAVAEAEAGRLAATRISAVESAEAAVALAESRVEAAGALAAQAGDALLAEEVRGPKRVAAEDRVRSLGAITAAAVELDAARACAAETAAEHAARSVALEDAKDVRSATEVRLAEARMAAGDASASSAELVKAQSAVEAAAASVEAAAVLAGLAGRIAAAEGAVASTTLEVASAADQAAEAVAQRDESLRQWRDGRSAALAGTLEPGRPCPVCGSTEHPAPAIAGTVAPSDEEVAAVEAAVRRTAASASAASARMSAASASLAALVAEEKATRETSRGAGGAEAAAAELALASDAFARASARAETASAALGQVADLETAAAEAAALAEAAQGRLHDADTAAALAAKGLATAEASVPEAMREPGALSGALEDARGVVAALTAAFATARERSSAAASSLAAAAATRDERAAALEAAGLEAKGVAAPDLASLEAASAEAASARDAAVAEAARLAQSCAVNAAAQARLAELDADASHMLERYSTVAAIANAATGSNPAKLSFQRYVLGVFLTDVLESATRRLEIMTRGRYRLHMAAGPRDRRSAAGLDLEVFDEYTGEDRPVGTLSGGEGFLASLALALGLAEVVESLAGGVHLDTVFIDEGFGTLDEEALETAIDALMELQGASRLVGIISHVTELQAVVPARLEVSSTPQGSTARFVVP